MPTFIDLCIELCDKLSLFKLKPVLKLHIDLILYNKSHNRRWAFMSVLIGPYI